MNSNATDAEVSVRMKTEGGIQNPDTGFGWESLETNGGVMEKGRVMAFDMD